VEELESIVDSATRVPGLKKRVMVDPNRLGDVVRNLASAIPADIQEAQEVIRQKDSIINQAHLEARRMKESADNESRSLIEAATLEHQSRIDETEIVKGAEDKAEEINQQALQEAQQIVQEAQRKAYRMIDEAEAVSSTRREGSDQYAREILFDLEERLANQLGEIRRGIDVLGLQVSTNGATPAHPVSTNGATPAHPVAVG
jgi:cell division septum initiation protein DivIVA